MGELDMLFVEVDGSLANPHAAGAVAVWSMMMSVIAVLAVRDQSTGARIPMIIVLCSMVLITSPAQRIIGNILYWLTGHQFTSVGFWGGPPRWIAPTAVSCRRGGVVSRTTQDAVTA